MWTYTTGTVASKAFDTPEVNKVDAISDGSNTVAGKFILVNDTTTIVENGRPLVAGVMHGESYLPARTIVSAAGDTLVKDSKVFYSDKGPTTQIGAQIAHAGQTINIDGNPVTLSAPAKAANATDILINVNFFSGKKISSFLISTISFPASISLLK